MNYQDIQKRLEAAGQLLNQSSTTREKFNSIRNLIKGISSKLDKLLDEAGKALSHLERVENLQVIELTAEAIPEVTEEDKRRKKALLLFLGFWKDLKSEVARVQTEVNQGKHISQPSTFAKIFSFAKGPFALITIAAVGIVYLNSNSVEVKIKNQGCDAINPVVKIPFPIAGLKLPSVPILNGDHGYASLPKMKINIDGTTADKIKVSAFNVSWNFDLNGDQIDLRFNGKLLNAARTEIDLGASSEHELIISCS